MSLINKEKTIRLFTGAVKKISCNLCWILIFGLILDVIFGAVLFWFFGFKKTTEPSAVSDTTTLNQALLKQFTTKYKANQALLQGTLEKTYLDIFRSLPLYIAPKEATSSEEQ